MQTKTEKSEKQNVTKNDCKWQFTCNADHGRTLLHANQRVEQVAIQRRARRDRRAISGRGVHCETRLDDGAHLVGRRIDALQAAPCALGGRGGGRGRGRGRRVVGGDGGRRRNVLETGRGRRRRRRCDALLLQRLPEKVVSARERQRTPTGRRVERLELRYGRRRRHGVRQPSDSRGGRDVREPAEFGNLAG